MIEWFLCNLESISSQNGCNDKIIVDFLSKLIRFYGLTSWLIAKNCSVLAEIVNGHHNPLCVTSSFYYVERELDHSIIICTNCYQIDDSYPTKTIIIFQSVVYNYQNYLITFFRRKIRNIVKFFTLACPQQCLKKLQNQS